MRKTDFLYFILIFICALTVSCGEPSKEDDPREYDSSYIENLNKSSRYDYDREIVHRDSWLLRFVGKIFEAIGWLFTSFFGYVILAGLLLLVVWVVVNNVDSFSTKPNTPLPDQVVELTPENVEVKDYDGLIKKALDKQDYKMAIRFTFLKLLTWFQSQGQIDWHKEKTNYEYLDEIPEKGRSTFMGLIRIYEYIWYGAFEASMESYTKVAAGVNKLTGKEAADD